MSPNKSIFFYQFFYKSSSYISKFLKIHQINISKIMQKDYKKHRERSESLSKNNKEKKCNNMVLNDTKNSQKKHKSWLSIENDIIRLKKTPCYNYKKLFSFREIVFFRFFLGLSYVRCADRNKKLFSFGTKLLFLRKLE